MERSVKRPDISPSPKLYVDVDLVVNSPKMTVSPMHERPRSQTLGA